MLLVRVGSSGNDPYEWLVLSSVLQCVTWKVSVTQICNLEAPSYFGWSRSLSWWLTIDLVSLTICRSLKSSQNLILASNWKWSLVFDEDCSGLQHVKGPQWLFHHLQQQQATKQPPNLSSKRPTNSVPSINAPWILRQLVGMVFFEHRYSSEAGFFVPRSIFINRTGTTNQSAQSLTRVHPMSTHILAVFKWISSHCRVMNEWT